MSGRVTTLIIRTSPPRKKPQAGDRKTVNGVEYVRRQVRCEGAYCVAHGRPVYEWVRA